MIGILAVFIGISALIALHEFGHYAIARLCGMDVQRFSIGFGPTLLAWQWGPTQFQIAMIPLGGYVQIAGLGELEEPALAEQEAVQQPALALPNSQEYGKLFQEAPLWQRFAVIAAGPAMNGLLAFVLLIPVAIGIGLPDPSLQPAVVGRIQAHSPAAKAELQPGDRIVQIDGQPIASWPELLLAMERNSPGEPVNLLIERETGAPIAIALIPQHQPGSQRPILGITMGSGPRLVLDSLPGALQAAWQQTSHAFGAQANGLWQMLLGRQGGQFTGLPGIAKLLHQQVQQSWYLLLESLATISISLCLLNLLPIPALDGARLGFLGAEAIARRKLPIKVEAIAHQIGMLALLALMVFVSLRDIWNW